MTPETRLYLMLLLPFGAAFACVWFGPRPNLREAAQLLLGTSLVAVVASLAGIVIAGARPVVRIGELVPGFPLVLRLEPLGLVFALVSSTLWVVTISYAIGYMRAHEEKNQTQFFACFGLAIVGVMGVALADNLLTLFVFYEVLTLSTYPLVTHYGTPQACLGGRTYALWLLGTSIGLLLAAIGWTWSISGRIDFVPGGVLRDAYQSGRISTGQMSVLLGLFAFGIGKAALMPVHRWLPAAMVAPTPVSALLHAVAVVKVGVFTMLKVVVYIFGIDLLYETGASVWLVYVASVSLLLSSWIAWNQDNLKRRLAYSTVSQLAYITLGAALAQPASIVGAGMHIVMHAMAKITLFFCAGAIYVTTHKTNVSQLRGLGRQMPWTMGAFFVASLSIIGLPPGGGLWSKWLLGLGAADAGHPWVIGVLMVSSLLSLFYLLPVAVLAFAEPVSETDTVPAQGEERSYPHRVNPGQQNSPKHSAGEDASRGAVQEGPLWCVIPLCLTAAVSVLLFFFSEPISRALLPLLQP